MKKIIFGTVFFLFIFSSVSAQTSDTKNKGGFYLKGSLAHCYTFKLNSLLTDIETAKIPNVLVSGSLGLYYDIKDVVFAAEIGVGGMNNGNTRIINVPCHILVGYKLSLPKNQSLVFAGNIGYELYNVYASGDKGHLDFENSVLSNSTMFHLNLNQMVLGPEIIWRNKICHVGIGYDFGCIPAAWKSGDVTISKSPKERIDRVHLDLMIHIAHY